MKETQRGDVVETSNGARLSSVVHHYNETSWFDMIPGERISFRVRSTQVNGRYSIIDSLAGPGSAPPRHSHVEDEIFYIISGTLTFAVDDEIFDVEPGGVVVVTAGTSHAWKNRTESDVHMLVIFSPGGIENLFSRLAGIDPQQFEAEAAKYGSLVLGPPIEG